MEREVYWVNSAAILRAQEVFPLSIIEAADADAELLRAAIVVLLSNEANARPARLDTVSRISYPKDRFIVRVLADGGFPGNRRDIQSRISLLREQGIDATVVFHDRYRGQMAILDEAIEASGTDVVAVTELHTPLDADLLHKLHAVHLDRISRSLPRP